MGVGGIRNPGSSIRPVLRDGHGYFDVKCFALLLSALQNQGGFFKAWFLQFAVPFLVNERIPIHMGKAYESSEVLHFPRIHPVRAPREPPLSPMLIFANDERVRFSQPEE